MIEKNNKYKTKIETIKRFNAFKHQKMVEKMAKKKMPVTHYSGNDKLSGGKDC